MVIPARQGYSSTNVREWTGRTWHRYCTVLVLVDFGKMTTVIQLFLLRSLVVHRSWIQCNTRYLWYCISIDSGGIHVQLSCRKRILERAQGTERPTLRRPKATFEMWTRHFGQRSSMHLRVNQWLKKNPWKGIQRSITLSHWLWWDPFVLVSKEVWTPVDISHTLKYSRFEFEQSVEARHFAYSTLQHRSSELLNLNEVWY